MEKYKILGITVMRSSMKEVLNFISVRYLNQKRTVITSINPEIVLIANKDISLRKILNNSDLPIPDGVGIAQAYVFTKFENLKNTLIRYFLVLFQGLFVGIVTLLNKKYITSRCEVVKGYRLFLELIRFAAQNNLKVYLFGGENGEQVMAKNKLLLKYPNLNIKCFDKSVRYNLQGIPRTNHDFKSHNEAVQDINLFCPDIIFVALGAPRQEKWINNNSKYFQSTFLMGVGGTYNVVSGRIKFAPEWMDNMGPEWLWRLINEPSRLPRILNATIIFPWKVFMWKLNVYK